MSTLEKLAKQFERAVWDDLQAGSHNRATAVARVVEAMIPHMDTETAGCLFDTVLATDRLQYERQLPFPHFSLPARNGMRLRMTRELVDAISAEHPEWCAP